MTDNHDCLDANSGYEMQLSMIIEWTDITILYNQDLLAIKYLKDVYDYHHS